MTKLYLDLEDTVITNWQDQVLKNTSKVKSFLDDNPDIDRHDVTIFSFAIYNQKDKDEFERDIKPMLERALDITCTAWPSVAEMAERDQKLTGCRWLDADTMGGLDICEFIQLRGKVGAFHSWVFYDAKYGSRHLLLDDIVPFRTLYDQREDIQVDTVNVDKDL